MNVKTILAAKGGDIVSIEATADLTAAAQLLAARRIGAIVIRGTEGRLAGMPAYCLSATSFALSRSTAWRRFRCRWLR